MKKIYTLIVGLLAFSLTANADRKEETLYFGGNAWNVNVLVDNNVTITSNSQWGEYKLTANSFNVNDYKGFRVEYSDLKAGDGGESWQVEVKNGSGTGQYLELTSDNNSVEGTFNKETFSTDPVITLFALQAKEVNASVNVVKAFLIKDDDTEEQLTFAGSDWGIDTSPFEAPTLTFTGQYGGQQLFDENGDACTYTVSEDEIQIYTVEFAEPIGTTECLFELDAENSGFDWINITDASATTFSFTLNYERLAAKGQNAEAIYFKYGGTDAPHTVKIKSMKRLVVTGDDVTGIENAVTNANADVVSTKYYTVGGQEVSAPVKGITILRQTLSNGNTVNKKVLIK